MGILITEKTPVIVQGMSGRIGQFHAADMIRHGTNVVGGVTPGKGGEHLLDRPLFNTVREAVEATRAEASLVFVPPPFAADAIMEAADAGIRTAVCVTDGIPSQDMMKVKRFLRRYPESRKMRLIGPNCAGIISPGKGFMGIMPPHIYVPGRVGIVGRSATLANTLLFVTGRWAGGRRTVMRFAGKSLMPILGRATQPPDAQNYPDQRRRRHYTSGVRGVTSRPPP